MVKRCYLLVVKNYTEIEDLSEIRPGIGLRNIQETVKKYNGILNVKVEDHIFEISIPLPLNCDVQSVKKTV